MTKIIVLKQCGQEKQCSNYCKDYSEGIVCMDCGKPISRGATRCKNCANKGSNNPNWKGGIVNYSRKNGIYRKAVYAPDNPMADKNGYVLRSRLIMSQMIGRPLTKDERVHHIDGDKTNDSPSNLRLFENESQHQRFHHRERRSDRLLRRLVNLPKDRIYRAMSFALSSFPSER